MGTVTERSSTRSHHHVGSPLSPVYGCCRPSDVLPVLPPALLHPLCDASLQPLLPARCYPRIQELQYRFSLPHPRLSPLITFSSKMTSAGTLVEDAAAVPVTTVKGNVEFQQNPLTGEAATYLIYLAGAGITANMKYKIGVATDCAGTGFMEIDEITAPFFLINGMHIAGATDMVNIDATGGKTSVTGMFFVVQGPSPATTTIGCSEAALV